MEQHKSRYKEWPERQCVLGSSQNSYECIAATPAVGQGTESLSKIRSKNNSRMCALRITLEDPVFVLFNCLPFSFLIIATFIVNTDESAVHPYCISLRSPAQMITKMPSLFAYFSDTRETTHLTWLLPQLQFPRYIASAAAIEAQLAMATDL